MKLTKLILPIATTMFIVNAAMAIDVGSSHGRSSRTTSNKPSGGSGFGGGRSDASLKTNEKPAEAQGTNKESIVYIGGLEYAFSQDSINAIKQRLEASLANLKNQPQEPTKQQVSTPTAIPMEQPAPVMPSTPVAPVTPTPDKPKPAEQQKPAKPQANKPQIKRDTIFIKDTVPMYTINYDGKKTNFTFDSTNTLNVKGEEQPCSPQQECKLPHADTNKTPAPTNPTPVIEQGKTAKDLVDQKPTSDPLSKLIVAGGILGGLAIGGTAVGVNMVNGRRKSHRCKGKQEKHIN